MLLSIKDLSSCCKIDMKKLQTFVENDLITSLGECDKENINQLSRLCTLYDCGLDVEEIKQLLTFIYNGNMAEQIKLLNVCRQKILDEIHSKQKSLDSLDFLIYKIKNKINPIF